MIYIIDNGEDYEDHRTLFYEHPTRLIKLKLETLVRLATGSDATIIGRTRAIKWSDDGYTVKLTDEAEKAGDWSAKYIWDQNNKSIRYFPLKVLQRMLGLKRYGGLAEDGEMGAVEAAKVELKRRKK